MVPYRILRDNSLPMPIIRVYLYLFQAAIEKYGHFRDSKTHFLTANFKI